MTKVKLDQKVSMMKRQILERESALKIWNAWKQSRSLRGLVFRAVAVQRDLDRRSIVNKMFSSDITELIGEINVDYRDWNAAQQILSQQLQAPLRVTADDVKGSLGEILGFNPVQDDNLLEQSIAAVQIETDSVCHSCAIEREGHMCAQCDRFFCTQCEIGTKEGVFCLSCHASTRFLGEEEEKETSGRTQTSSFMTDAVASNLPPIDACTLQAAVIFSLSPAYPHRDTLLHALLVVLDEWASCEGDRLEFVRGLHFFYHLNPAGAVSALEEVLGEYLRIHKAQALQDLEHYVTWRKDLVDNDDVDSAFFTIIASVSKHYRQEQRLRRVEHQVLAAASCPQVR